MVLAPMHDVTDTAFRQTVAHFSKPDAMFTEFVSVDGLTHPQSQEKITHYYLRYNKSEHQIIAQIWGSDPYKFKQSAEYLGKLGFDGIDINMGCPDKSVIKQGGGAALINSPKLAVQIIEATKEGVGNIPVSVKTRLGFDSISIESWMETLVKAKPAAITIHARTKKELSMVPPHWDEVQRAAKIAQGSGIKIIGNGDVKNIADGKRIAEEFGLGGIMVGRAALGNPWFFDESFNYEMLEICDRLEALVFHAKKFEKEFQGIKRFNHFRKHIKAYISGFREAGKLRSLLMTAKNYKELDLIVEEYKSNSLSLSAPKNLL